MSLAIECTVFTLITTFIAYISVIIEITMATMETGRVTRSQAKDSFFRFLISRV